KSPQTERWSSAERVSGGGPWSAPFDRRNLPWLTVTVKSCVIAFAKDLPRESRKLPRGLANPWRLPALHHPRFGEERKKGMGVPAARKQRIGVAERWLLRLGCGGVGVRR